MQTTGQKKGSDRRKGIEWLNISDGDLAEAAAGVHIEGAPGFFVAFSPDGGSGEEVVATGDHPVLFGNLDGHFAKAAAELQRAFFRHFLHIGKVNLVVQIVQQIQMQEFLITKFLL